jgi:hypothetical protein
MLSTGLEEPFTAYSFVSGAATCGGRYYASAVDPPMDAGLMVVEIQTGKTEILDWNNSPALKSMNLHNMYCDPEDKNGQTLYVVENVIDGTQSYSVWKMKIDSDYKVTQDKIADFPLNAKMVPTAYDTEFQITPDLKTVYSLWTTMQASAAFVISVDLESGSTKTYTLESGRQSVPYALLVDESGHMEIVISKHLTSGGNEYSSCLLVLEGGDAKTSHCQERDELYLGGMPWTTQLSDGMFYTLSSRPEQRIVSLKPDATIVDSISLEEIFAKENLPNGVFGGIAVAL